MSSSIDDHCRDRQFMVAGDLAPLVAEFTRHLSQEGYTDLTVRGFDHAARHLAHWLTEAEIAVADIDETVVGRFARHRCRCPGGRSTKQLSGPYVKRARRFVAFLVERGMVRQKAASAASVPDRRVEEFQDWLRKHRGLSERTIEVHGYLLMRLLPALRRRPRSWDAQHIREVIIAETKRAARGHVKKMASTLRGYVRFLSANGRCRAGLEHAVPMIAQWRLSTLPRYIDTAQVEQLIATCDPSTPTGLRDRAILLLLARLGLRAGDIVSLRLGDLDWQRATVSVRGKGRRETRLPLPQDAGDAVLAYLERARPRIEGDRVFFMLNAPIRPLVDSRAVTGIVRGAIRKAGIDAPTKGANLLRHSAATAMLRGGASLDMVGAVLRHRSPDMTAHLRQGRRHDAAPDRAALAGRRVMLSRDLQRYVDGKRSLGFKFRSQSVQLTSFVAFAEGRGDRYIRSARVLAWAAKAPSPEHRRSRLLTVRRFALAMRAEDARHQVPGTEAVGHATTKRRSPYIYAPDEIARLLQAAATLEPAGSIRPIMYTTLLGLIAATGVRIAEALALHLDDVTADGLVIRETKFQKSRLLPLHATVRQVLDRYLATRRDVPGGNALFVSGRGRPLPYNSVRYVFLTLLDRSGLRGAHSGRDPRIHDLRHTFAVRSLEQCSHDRTVVARHIVALSTYLGHAHVTDTYWYLQATPVLMGQIAEAGEALLTGGAA